MNPTLLSSVPTALDSAAIRGGLGSSRIGGAIVCFGEIGSTNDYARMWAQHDAPDGACVFAEYQTKGRGRRDHAWQSPPGLGILVSVVLNGWRAGQYGRRVPPTVWIPALGALAVRNAVAGVTGLSPQLKWPNDVVVDGRKLAGVLAESAGAAKPVILGIGVNVLTSSGSNAGPGAGGSAAALSLPPDVAARSISVQQVLEEARAREARHRQSLAPGTEPVDNLRVAVARRLLLELDLLYGTWLEPEGPNRIAQLYREALATLGQWILVHEAASDESAHASAWEGVARDLCPDGALLVVDAAGREHRLTSGSASIRPIVRPERRNPPRKS